MFLQVLHGIRIGAKQKITWKIASHPPLEWVLGDWAGLKVVWMNWMWLKEDEVVCMIKNWLDWIEGKFSILMWTRWHEGEMSLPLYSHAAEWRKLCDKSLSPDDVDFVEMWKHALESINTLLKAIQIRHGSVRSRTLTLVPSSPEAYFTTLNSVLSW